MQANLNFYNPDALVDAASVQLLREEAGHASLQESFIKNYLGKVQQFRLQKIRHLESLFKSSSLKDRLGATIKKLLAQKNIIRNEKWLKYFKNQRQEAADRKMREGDRRLKFIHDVDASRDGLLEDDAQRPPVLPAKNDALTDEAFVQTLKQLYSAQANRSQSQNQLHDQMDRAVSEQKQSAEGALRALKKSKIFGFVFQVFERFTQSLVSVFTMGAGSPLVKWLAKASGFLKILVPSLVQTGNDLFMQFLNDLILKPIHAKLENAGIEQKNAASYLYSRSGVMQNNLEHASVMVQKNKKQLQEFENVQIR